MSNLLKTQVKEAYSDCNGSEGKRNLDFRASVAVNGDALLDIMGEAVPDGYNNFHPVRTIKRIIEAFGNDASYYVAREGSVCLYVKPARSAWIGSRGLKEGFAKADEISIENDGSVRLWWD